MPAVLGRIVTPTGIVEGCLAVSEGRIAEIGPAVHVSGRVHDFGRDLIVPGFIDVHMHGLGEFDVFEFSQLVEIARMQPRFGTTGFLPTVASLSPQRYIEFGHNVRKAQKACASRAARIIGAHFEGPFINPEGRGGMDAAYLRPVDLGECKTYLDEVGDVLKLMTLSPELEGSGSLIRLLRTNGVVASLGHSRASKEDLHAAIEAGLTQVCHLFNTFERTPLRAGWQWTPNLLVCILISDRLNCEVICDMLHVLPEFVKLAVKTLGPRRFLAITDSLPGAGLEPGKYLMVDGREFSTTEGIARLTADGTVVGSVLTMNRAFANLVEQCGFDPVTASWFTSTNPAAALGLQRELGSIQVGRWANLAVLDSDYNCVATFMEGQLLHGD